MKKTDIENWLKKYGVDPEAVTKALTTDEDVEITLPDGDIYTEDKINELKTNVKKGHEKAYSEILGKQLNAEHELGLSVTDAKDLTKVMAAMEAKGEKKGTRTPNEKVQELESSLEKLRNQLKEKDGEVSTWQNKFKEREIFDTYASLVPENANKFLTREEHVNRIKSLVDIGENGIAIDRTTGQPFKDKLENPRKLAEVVGELYTSREGWIQPEPQTPKPAFVHGTPRPSVSGNNRTMNYDAKLAEVYSKYDMSTLEGRKMAQAELTAAQVNAK